MARRFMRMEEDLAHHVHQETLARNSPRFAMPVGQGIVGDESQSGPGASPWRNGQGGGTAPSAPGIRRVGSGGAGVPHSTACQ